MLTEVICMCRSTGTISFIENSATSNDDNSPRAGGAFYASGTSEAYFCGSVIAWPHCIARVTRQVLIPYECNHRGVRCTRWIGNRANRGGAIYIMDSARIEFFE